MYYLRMRPAAQAIQFTKEAKAVDQSNATLQKGNPPAGIPTPSSSSESSPARPVKCSTSALAAAADQALQSLSLDDKARQATGNDPECTAAFQRQQERELEEAKLMCSIENKEACLMWSG